MYVLTDKWKRADTLLLLITFVLTLMALVHHTGSEQKPQVVSLPRPGYEAPSFELVALDGQTVRLEDLRGQKVFLNFWASWCPPCNDEMPDMVRLSEKYKDDVVFVGVNLTSNDQMDNMQAFVDKYGVEYSTLLDTEGSTAQKYRVFAVPTTLIIDQYGKVVDRRDGPLSATHMEEFVQKVMEVK